MIQGIGASPGISMCKVMLLTSQELEIEKRIVDDVDKEWARMNDARKIAQLDLLALHKQTLESIGEEEARIFESHLMMLDDPEMLEQVQNQINADKVNAEWALKGVCESFIQIFDTMDDAYMKERAADLRDVYERLARNLLGVKKTNLSLLDESVILVASDLTPSDTASMDKSKVVGFLTDIGGRTSHTAIMARTLEVPAIVGLDNITERVSDGDFVAFNGDSGEVIINPDGEELGRFQNMKSDYDAKRDLLTAMKNKASKTLDGRTVELAGNIGTPEDVKNLLRNDAEGVGLYRTEFLFMDRNQMPTEEEQYISYKTVLEAMGSKPVVIRTLDVGGDKELSYLDIEKEMNPFLGYRAIRLCLDRTDIFKIQLRALLRASVHGNLKIMFPMISSLEEYLSAKAILDETTVELRSEGVTVAEKIEVGMMIEVPSAALISDILAKYVDFFSIGTNDLIQYTCAVDRMNQKIHHLYSPFNPGVLRLIKQVIENAHKEGKWVGMCGEMAGDKHMIPLLLGLGLDEFSMSPISILEARKQICDMTLAEAKRLAEHVMTLETSEAIEEYLKEYVK